MFTSNNTDSQASNASPYDLELAQPEQTQVLELSEQDLEQVSGGFLKAGARFIGGQLFKGGSQLVSGVSGVVRDLNNNSDIYRNLR